MDRHPFLKRAKARKVSGFLDSTHTTKVLRAILLTMTHSLADMTDEVLKRWIRHWWVREKSFIGGRKLGRTISSFDFCSGSKVIRKNGLDLNKI